MPGTSGFLADSALFNGNTNLTQSQSQSPFLLDTRTDTDGPADGMTAAAGAQGEVPRMTDPPPTERG